MKKTFERGDIVSLNFELPTGNADSFALVISAKEFNALGLTMITPICLSDDFARYAGFAVPLPTSSNTQGVVLANMMRSMDLSAYGAELVETVGREIVAEVLARIRPVLEI